MDTPSEDTIVRQIEKNLSDNMNDNLFLTGRVIESNKQTVRNRYTSDKSEEIPVSKEADRDYPLVSYDYISNSPGLSRAEYIRQAREACLRQLSAVQIYSKPYDVNYMETDTPADEQLNQKKAKVMKLFHNNLEEENTQKKENTVRDLLSYRSLILRSVCAIALFLSIFLVDKFNVVIGKFSYGMIQEYVTGNDALTHLENILVTWLK